LSDKLLRTCRPRFSVVIPAYNEASYIAKTLLSLSKQDFKGGFELIVVDNNCTDNTAVIAKQHGARVVNQPTAGTCWARQAGTLSAKGQIIISTDADTTFSQNWLSRIDKDFTDNPKAVAVCGPCQYVLGPLWGRVYARWLFGLVNFVYKFTGQPFYASATNIAFKKSAFVSYDTNLPQGGDELDLIRQLKQQGIVEYDNHNPTYTSSRRLERGFIYNFFVSWLIYYIIEYNLNRLFKRPILGVAPSFRTDLSTRRQLFIKLGWAALPVMIFILARHQAVHLAEYASDLI
jgi:glycosyltransferase involved in cell wall biosynthesis